MRAGAVVVAAGAGRRMQCAENKVFLRIGGTPVLLHSLRVFAAHPAVAHIVVVARAGEEERVRTLAQDLLPAKPLAVVTGGAERQDSVYAGLRALEGCDVVLVHDAARPFVRPQHVDRLLAAVEETGAACLGVPVKDTVKRVDADGTIAATPPRSSLWLAQTPQAFWRTLLLEAHEAARADGVAATDDAALVERLGHPVRMVMGDYDNLKITTPEDVVVAEALLRWREGDDENRTRF
ncbi:MAG: 2-C-methyl-D-erythritol 4-phosphate cytidylyltransferase [Calditerricola sp.]|nr:2-C-methyl-D-erythritol 4-phosphate cytidylyltransferase [Calditerricola sp.]